MDASANYDSETCAKVLGISCLGRSFWAAHFNASWPYMSLGRSNSVRDDDSALHLQIVLFRKLEDVAIPELLNASLRSFYALLSGGQSADMLCGVRGPITTGSSSSSSSLNSAFRALLVLKLVLLWQTLRLNINPHQTCQAYYQAFRARRQACRTILLLFLWLGHEAASQDLDSPVSDHRRSHQTELSDLNLCSSQMS